jgi:hypothetical protein
MTQSTEKLSASHSEEHMLGHGFYNKHSHEQAKANTYALSLIVEAFTRIDFAQIGSEFRIVDYGSAQGQNSLLPMKTAIAQIRTLDAKAGRATMPISVTHTDLPTNDWSTLFQTVLFSPDSYLAGERDVFLSRDLFSQRLQSALAQDPAKYSCRWVLHLMLISKKQK